MPDEVKLTIDTREWEDLLKALPMRVAKRAVRNALQAGGDVLLDAMVAECPERTDEPTPDSDALQPGVLKESLCDQVVIGTRYNPSVKVGPGIGTGHVAYWVENGFDHIEGGKRGEKASHVTKHVDANPFMVRSFDSSIERAVDVMLANLASSLGQDLADDSPSDSEYGGEDY
jgi:hypothetical protein